MFATQDEDLHRTLRRPIAGIYSMSNIMSFERYVDSTMRVFFEQLDKLFVQTGDFCDLGVWLQMFAFDVMGEITFSKRLGFLESAKDVDGIMESIWRYFQKASPVCLWSYYLIVNFEADDASRSRKCHGLTGFGPRIPFSNG